MKASGLESRAAWTGGRRWGREERHFLQYKRARGRLWASAGQAPERRWGRQVSLGGVTGGQAASSGLPGPVAPEPQGVGAAAEGEEGGAEELEAGQSLCLGDKLTLPVGSHCAPHSPFPGRLRERVRGEC